MLSSCKSDLFTSYLSELLKDLRSEYNNMLTRCYHDYADSYNSHGGKGIGVCKEWLDSFDAFAIWALDHGYHKSLSLDRIDNSRDYGPDNCRWVTTADQNRNRTNSKMAVYLGDRVSITATCAEHDIKPKTIYKRLKQDMEFEDAIDLPESATDAEVQQYRDLCEIGRLHHRAFRMNAMRAQHNAILEKRKKRK